MDTPTSGDRVRGWLRELPPAAQFYVTTFDTDESIVNIDEITDELTDAVKSPDVAKVTVLILYDTAEATR